MAKQQWSLTRQPTLKAEVPAPSRRLQEVMPDLEFNSMAPPSKRRRLQLVKTKVMKQKSVDFLPTSPIAADQSSTSNQVQGGLLGEPDHIALSAGNNTDTSVIIVSSDSSVITLSSSNSNESSIPNEASCAEDTSTGAASQPLALRDASTRVVMMPCLNSAIFAEVLGVDSPQSSPSLGALGNFHVAETSFSQSSSAHLSFTSPTSVPETLFVDSLSHVTSPELSSDVSSHQYVSETASVSPSLLSAPSGSVPESASDRSCSSARSKTRHSYVSETSSSLFDRLSGDRMDDRETGIEEDIVHSTYFVPDTQVVVPDSMPSQPLFCQQPSSTRWNNRSSSSSDFDMSFINDLL